jgi:transaldolase
MNSGAYDWAGDRRPRVPHERTASTSRDCTLPSPSTRYPKNALQAFADHGELEADWSAGGAASKGVLDESRATGIDLDTLAKRLQDEGAASFVASWNDLLGVIGEKSDLLNRQRREAAS